MEAFAGFGTDQAGGAGDEGDTHDGLTKGRMPLEDFGSKRESGYQEKEDGSWELGDKCF